MCVCVYQVETGARARGRWGGEGQGKCLDEYLNSHSLPKKCKVPQHSSEERGYIWLKKTRAALWTNVCLASHITSDHHFQVFSAQFFFGSDHELISAFPFPDHSTYLAILLPSAPSRPLPLLPVILLKNSNNHFVNIVLNWLHPI